MGMGNKVLPLLRVELRESCLRKILLLMKNSVKADDRCQLSLIFVECGKA